MIEKIQFGGITRRPSDLMAKEGSCEESLNVVLDVNEVAPVIEPEDRTTSLLGNTADVAANTTDRFIYIHKTGSYENYIALNETGNDLRAYIAGVRSTSALISFTSIGETYQSITSIGNTLIVSTNKNLHYILFKEGAYVHLGTKIPEPLVEFRAVPLASGEGTITVSEDMDMVDAIKYYKDSSEFNLWFVLAVSPHQTGETVKEFWDSTGKLYGVKDDLISLIYVGTQSTETYYLHATSVIDSVSDYIWDTFARLKQGNAADKIFSTPVFVRSALKLYDESYIYQSVPFLLHHGSNCSVAVNIDTTTDGGGFTMMLSNAYKAKAIISYPDLSDWGDIVRSVDIFASTDVNNPKVNARISGVETTIGGTDYLSFRGQSGYSNPEDLREELLSKVNFYLIESKNVGDIGTGLTLNLTPYSQDDLVVKETLPDDSLSHHGIGPVSGVLSYNSRLVLKGLTTRIYSGHPFLQSTYFQLGTEKVVEMKYYIRQEDGMTYTVIGRNSTGGQQFTYPSETVGPSGSTVTYVGVPSGFFYYPDPRCYKVELFVGDSSAASYGYSIPMKEHPGLNGAYAICSLASPISSAGQSITNPVYPAIENKSFAENNKLVMSEAMNPFQFLLTNRLTFADEIYGVATTTKALSSGQFGQFPLYVFTKGGTWAVPITSTGAMSDAVPVSRDVVLSEESITPIDQAIVLVTEKGVMLLSGSDIRDISPEMDGRHYAIESAASALLEDTTWYKYVSILSDKTPFMTFMKDARAIYDYAGRKLIFFNGKSALLKSYQYVYKMDTGTWHKMSLLQTNFSYAGILNGYPDALVCMRNASSVYRVCELSVAYNPSVTQNTLSQVIITRPLDLNLAHVHKTVKRLFARGIFDHSHIKYLLLGSPDGQTYHVIHSLRGPSNNIFFRIMVFGTLTPTERLSYMEVEYEPRFAGRPR